jgi:hypothetical protein
MPEPVRLWIETTHHTAFRYGGWGFVREEAGAVSGQAGGERNITAPRVDLLALIAALHGLAPAAAVTIASASPGVVAVARILATPPGAEDAPAEDLDLWAQALKLSAGRALTVRPAQRAPTTPAAFCFAWAEVGRDKAKGQGRFSATIPRPNLSKLILPAR